MNCPVCRRRSLDDTPICARCGADLQVLLQLEQRYIALCQQGNALLRSGAVPAAKQRFLAALAIHRNGAEAHSGAALCCLHQHDFATAVEHHASVKKP